MMAAWVRSMLFLFLISILQPGVVYLIPEDCDVTFAGICYKSHNYARGTYYDAVRNCSDDNGRLANISTNEIKEALAPVLKTSFTNARIQSSIFNPMPSEPSWITNFSEHRNSDYYDSRYNTYWINGNSSLTIMRPSRSNECMIWNPSTNSAYFEHCDYWNKFVCEYGGYSCPIGELDVPNGFFEECHNGKNLPYKTVVNIQCDNGYILEGPSNTTCTTNGSWSSLPRCVPGCSAPDPINFATLISTKATYNLGEKATYVCERNFYSSVNPRETHITVTCHNESTWIPSKISCEPKGEVKIEAVDVKVGDSFTLHCDANEIGGKDGENQFGKWQWLKDSKNIRNLSFNTTIERVSGDLIVPSFTQEAVGTYVCMHTGNKTCTGKTAYYVREIVKCDPYDNQTETHSFHEGDSAYLMCEYSNPDADMTWLYNGSQIVSNTLKQILPDNTLYLSNIDVSVAGMYTCIVRNRFSNCEYIKGMRVSVTAYSGVTCGSKYLAKVQPWTVSLWWYDEIAPFCYGVIVDSSWVLTSAHCIFGFNRKRNPKIFVQLGNPGNDSDSINTRIPIQSMVIHRKFSQRLYLNDIGLIKLKEKIPFSNRVAPICLTSKEVIPENKCSTNSSINGVVSGWGSLDKSPSEEIGSLLQEPMKIITSFANTTCQIQDNYTKSTICSERMHKGGAIFPGDSGSPLVVPWKGQMYLLGIYSWGERGAYHGAKEYFTKVSEYMYWMKGFIKSL